MTTLLTLALIVAIIVTSFIWGKLKRCRQELEKCQQHLYRMQDWIDDLHVENNNYYVANRRLVEQIAGSTKEFSDEALYRIYKEANNEVGKARPLTTQSIFTAMRAVAKLARTT